MSNLARIIVVYYKQGQAPSMFVLFHFNTGTINQPTVD